MQNAEKVRQQLEAASPEREQAIQPTSPVALNGSGIDGYRATFGPAHRPAKPRSVSSEGSDGGNAENGHPNEREGGCCVGKRCLQENFAKPIHVPFVLHVVLLLFRGSLLGSARMEHPGSPSVA